MAMVAMSDAVCVCVCMHAFVLSEKVELIQKFTFRTISYRFANRSDKYYNSHTHEKTTIYMQSACKSYAESVRGGKAGRGWGGSIYIYYTQTAATAAAQNATANNQFQLNGASVAGVPTQ